MPFENLSGITYFDQTFVQLILESQPNGNFYNCDFQNCYLKCAITTIGDASFTRCTLNKIYVESQGTILLENCDLSDFILICDASQKDVSVEIVDCFCRERGTTAIIGVEPTVHDVHELAEADYEARLRSFVQPDS